MLTMLTVCYKANIWELALSTAEVNGYAIGFAGICF